MTTRARTVWIAGAVALVVAAAGLGNFAYKHHQSDAADRAARAVAQEFVTRWRAGSLAQVPWVGATGASMQSEYLTAIKGMGGLRPDVQLGPVVRHGDSATATINVRWSLGAGVTWAYPRDITLQADSTSWTVREETAAQGSDFAPITRDSRLVLTRTQPNRADLTGAGGTPIVKLGEVIDVGIEPSRATDVTTLVHQVASITGVQAGPLAQAVNAAGANDFVPVITLRLADYAKVRDRLRPLKGTVFRTRTQPLGLTQTFARALIGTVGPVTAEILSQSPGRYTVGDYAGISGLQRQYDGQLAGTVGVQVSEVPATSTDTNADAPTDDDATPVFTVTAKAGQPVATTLDPRTQEAADAALAPLKVSGALVAVSVKSGSVLAVANTPAGGLNRAMVGQYPPGSMLKVATTLALLQGGLKSATPVDCPPTRTVDGRTFRNYEHEQFGVVPFSVDFANSCNTAFVGLSPRLSDSALHASALQLGLGGSWGAGLGAGDQTLTGSVPVNTSAVDKAASAFGQGRTLVSPLAMAVAAGTVARGRFLAPSLVTTPTPAAATGVLAGATPSPTVISTLHSLMRKVVTSGTAAGKLSGVPGGPIYAKTGTAEFGGDTPPQTHAWLMGWQGDIAFCAFVDTGASGASAAGPVVKAFLTALQR